MGFCLITDIKALGIYLIENCLTSDQKWVDQNFSPCYEFDDKNEKCIPSILIVLILTYER